MGQLLVVEDNKELNRGLRKALKRNGFRTFSSLNAVEAQAQLVFAEISLVLLDSGLSDGNGLNLLRKIKAFTPTLPVILLIEKDIDLDVSIADDYIIKPFTLSALQTRIKGQLQKTFTQQTKQMFVIDHFLFDFVHMQFWVNGDEVELNKTEQQLLYLLVANQGVIMNRSDLADRIWARELRVEENALSVAVSRLRSKLGAQNYIKTIYGVGYCWEKVTVSSQM